MKDSAAVLIRTAAGVDSHNRPLYTYAAQPSTYCGVKNARNWEAREAGGAVGYDYEIRLPFATAVGREDRITIIARHGSPDFVSVICEIVGEIDAGATAKVLKVAVIINE